MKKMIKFVKKNILVVLLLIINVTVLANNKILSEQVSYTNSKTQETTVEGSLDELFSAVDINNRLGDTTKISSIGTDGTVTGAISTLNSSISKLNSDYERISDAFTTLGSISNPNEALHGCYMVTANHGEVFNVPYPHGILESFIADGNNHYRHQTYHAYNGTVWQRLMWGGTWFDWVEITTKNNMDNISVLGKMDLNDIPELSKDRAVSFNYYPLNAANSPNPNGYGIVLSYRINGTDNIAQICFDVYTGTIYVRSSMVAQWKQM